MSAGAQCWPASSALPALGIAADGVAKPGRRSARADQDRRDCRPAPESMPTSTSARSKPCSLRSRTPAQGAGGKSSAAGRDLSADHQTKPDVAASIARKWFDTESVKTITGLGSSSVGFAVRKVAQEKDQIDLNLGRHGRAHRQGLLGDRLPLGLRHLCARQGDRRARWPRPAATAGTSSPPTTPSAIRWSRTRPRSSRSSGGKVLGAVRAPLSTPISRPSCCRPRRSKAKVIGLANAGTDTVNSIKQAGEFGIIEGRPEARRRCSCCSTDVHALGLKDAQGLVFTEAFYWDQNDETRAFTKRFQAKHGKPPTMMQAGIYSAALHYLKAVQGGRHRRHQGGDGQDARDAGQRLHDQERHDPRGRPHDARHVPRRR